MRRGDRGAVLHEFRLAARDERDSQRKSAPLMIALGAKVINNSNMTADETSALIIEEVKRRLNSLSVGK